MENIVKQSAILNYYQHKKYLYIPNPTEKYSQKVFLIPPITRTISLTPNKSKINTQNTRQQLIQSQQRYWISQRGRFLKSPRVTHFDSIIKSAQNSPGPGTYTNSDLQSNNTSKICQKKIHKSTFISQKKQQKNKNPIQDTYLTSSLSIRKQFLPPKKINTTLSFCQQEQQQKEKESMQYGVINRKKNNNSVGVIKKTYNPNFGVNKSNRVVFGNVVKKVNNIPGYYRGNQRAFSSFIVGKRPRRNFITQCKIQKINETETQVKKWVSGPGAYLSYQKRRK